MARRTRRAMAEINVVPYIDVMLVLLIIFMVAAPLINPGQIDLPQAAARLDPAVAPLEVRVRANGDLFIAGDKAVRYEEVLKVMDILQQNQVKRIGLLARPAGP